MDYSIFWAKHINKPDTAEMGVRVIVTDQFRKSFKKEAASATAKVVSHALDKALVKSKGRPILYEVEVWVERDKFLKGYQVGFVVKTIGNKGWRNWFPLPVIMRREQFREIDKVVPQIELEFQQAIEPLCQVVMY